MDDHLAVIEAALAPHLDRDAVQVLLAPIDQAVARAPAKRKRAALIEAIEQLDDVLEAFLIVMGRR